MNAEQPNSSHLAVNREQAATVSKAHDAEPFKCGLPAVNDPSWQELRARTEAAAHERELQALVRQGWLK